MRLKYSSQLSLKERKPCNTSALLRVLSLLKREQIEYVLGPINFTVWFQIVGRGLALKVSFFAEHIFTDIWMLLQAIH